MGVLFSVGSAQYWAGRDAGIALGGLGLFVGGIIGSALSASRRKSRATSEPGPAHLETNAPNVELVGDPNQAQATVLRTLPAGTRVVIMDEGANEPFNSSGEQWVKVRVTTGTDMGAEGWVHRPQLVSRAETTDVTPEVAARLFEELATATFTTDAGNQTRIPYTYPVDGCYCRAHRMSSLLTEKGYASEKVFAVSHVTATAGGTRGGLRVPTPYAEDVASGEPAVDWWYHVAPIIKVRDDNGQLVETVLDPSIAPGPVTIDGWTRLMSNESFTRKTLDEIDEMVEREGDYPRGQNLTFTTPRKTYQPPKPGVPLEPLDVEAQSRSKLTEFAALAQVHELAANIRREMRTTPISVSAIVSTISAAPVEARMKLESSFPSLLHSLETLISPADMQRVKDALNAPP